LDNFNSIKIHQAYFGEVNRSHSCIDIELDDTDLKSFLTSFTDRPGAIPLGISLKPYISGTSFSNYYILTKTFSDECSSRSGMVFTHVLIIDLNEFLIIKNLNEVFKLFVDGIPSEKTIEKISLLKESFSVKENISDLLPTYIQETASALLGNKTPVIFCGELPAFEETLAKIWLGLPEGLRNKLKFRVSFTQNDIENRDDLLLVYVQNNLISKWNGIEIVNSENSELIKIISPSIKLLVGQIANNPILDFIEKLNINLIEFDLIGMCDRAYTIYSKIEESNSDSIIQLIRLLSKLSPDQNDGKQIKVKVLNKLKDLLINGKHWNLKSFRNISFNAFENGELIISQAMTSFIVEVFKNSTEINLAIVSEWINIAASNEKRTDYWHKTVNKSLVSIMNSEDENTIKNIWKLVNNSDLIVSIVFNFVSKQKKQEIILRKYFPTNLKVESAKAIEVIAKKRNWFLLHADCLLTHLKTNETVKEQLKIESKLDFDESIGFIYLCKKLSNPDIIKLTLEHKDRKLIKIIGDLSLSDKSLFTNIDLSKTVWLEILSESLKKTKDLNYGSAIDSAKKAKLIYTKIIDGDVIPEIILELLSKSVYADLKHINDRTSFWKKIPLQFKEAFLISTARGVIEKLINNKLVGIEIESELKGIIISDNFMSMILNMYHNKIGDILIIYSQFPDLKDKFLADYIWNYKSTITSIQSEQLGNFVLSRNYYLSSSMIFEKAKYNESFRIALNKCKNLLSLGFWDSFKWSYLFGSEIDENIAFSALTELVLKLYPKGPEENDIWKRSEGNISKLTSQKTREENWRSAINGLKNGQGSEITVKTLFKEMEKDFPQNSEINSLMKYFRK